MKTLILYFTGTGNSLMVAKSIAKHLGDTELLHFSKIRDRKQIEPIDALGLVFPVYWNGPPHIVLNSIPSLKALNPAYIFSIATHAGGPGHVLSHLRAELEKNGLILNAGKCLEMPSNYILGYNAPSESSIQRDLVKADRALQQFTEIIRSAKEYQPRSDFPPFSGATSDYQQFIATVNESDADFWVSEDCTGCGLCESVCPVQNIELEEGVPTWHHRCEQCLACINWCPEAAIQYGRATSRRGRYVNPRISIEEMKR
jgi:ferredoxin